MFISVFIYANGLHKMSSNILWSDSSNIDNDNSVKVVD